jgi:hypothetical protein
MTTKAEQHQAVLRMHDLLHGAESNINKAMSKGHTYKLARKGTPLYDSLRKLQYLVDDVLFDLEMMDEELDD